MKEIKGALRDRLRERPFDFYAAIVIFIAGGYALVSPYWPEATSAPQINVMINIISAYMMIAAAIVLSALICNQHKRPIYAVLAEMWGWFAIAAASFAVSLMYLAKIVYSGSENLLLGIALMLIWFGMFLASGFRSLDIYLLIKGVK